MKKVEVTVASWEPNYGELTIAIDGVWYRYSGISPYLKEKFVRLQKRNIGQALRLLRGFRYEKITKREFELPPLWYFHKDAPLNFL